MAVVHDLATASHAAASSSISQASFSWSHAGSASARAVLVLVVEAPSATSVVTSVTYGTTTPLTVPAVTGGSAADTVTEPGRVTAFFLDNLGAKTGTQTVTVNRSNTTQRVWAVACTVTCANPVETAGIVLRQENAQFDSAEVSVDDGSFGSNSVRYAACYSGASSAPGIGANSTNILQNAFGAAYSGAACFETTAGTGSRPVGFTASNDDWAAVYLALRDTVIVKTGLGQSARTGGGASQKVSGATYTKQNIGIAPLTGSGGSVPIYAERGAGVASFSGSGVRVGGSIVPYFRETFAGGTFDLTDRGDGGDFWVNGWSSTPVWDPSELAFHTSGGPYNSNYIAVTGIRSGSGQYSSVNVKCFNNNSHFGFAGTNSQLSNGPGKNEEVWYSFWIKVPSLQESGAAQNWRQGFTSSAEWHLDGVTPTDQTAYNGAAVLSNTLGIQQDAVTGSTSPTNQRWRIQLAGGSMKTNTSTNVTYVDRALSLDTWYHHVLHFVLGETTGKALTEWWINDALIYPHGTGTVVAVDQQNANGTQPTQYVEDDATMANPGRLSYGTGFEMMVYRSATVVGNFTIDYAQPVWGPSSGAIGDLITESGSGITVFTGGGVPSKTTGSATYTKTGAGVSPRVGSGADAIDALEAGSGISIFTGGGADAYIPSVGDTYLKTGLGIIGP